MNKFCSYLLDHTGLFLLHSKRSKEHHFKPPVNQPEAVELSKLSGFYEMPSLPGITFHPNSKMEGYIIGDYEFESEIRTSYSENNRCTGKYYENQNADEDAHVIFVHGWRMDDFEKIKLLFLKKFMQKGYHMYFFSLPYHFERNPKTALYNGEYMISANINRTIEAAQQTVSDLRALIQWLKHNRPGKIIVIGVSLGGLFTNLTATVEIKIDALISIFYANSLAYSVWETIPGKFIKSDFESNGFTYERLQSCWAYLNPSHFKPVIPQNKILLMSAMYDQYVKINDANLLWESWGRPQRIIYPCGHAGIVFNRKTIARDVTFFLQNEVKLGGEMTLC